jgi:hypothetical protein
MMKIDKLALFGLFLISITMQSHAILLTGFGTSSATEPAFVIDGLSTTFTTSQTSDNLQITGSDFGNNIGGSFSVENTTGLSVLSLTGTLNGINPESNFSLQLFDGTVFQTYLGNWASYGTGSPVTVQLSLSSTDGGYNSSLVQGVLISANAAGDNLDFTLERLEISAVPEPSTALLLTMGLGFAYLTKRKRK